LLFIFTITILFLKVNLKANCEMVGRVVCWYPSELCPTLYRNEKVE